jgi:hypothetical protein
MPVFDPNFSTITASLTINPLMHDTPFGSEFILEPNLFNMDQGKTPLTIQKMI